MHLVDPLLPEDTPRLNYHEEKQTTAPEFVRGLQFTACKLISSTFINCKFVGGLSVQNQPCVQTLMETVEILNARYKVIKVFACTCLTNISWGMSQGEPGSMFLPVLWATNQPINLFICLDLYCANSSHLMTLYRLIWSRPYSLINVFTEIQYFSHEHALGDSGEKKLPFNRLKPRTQRREATCLDQSLLGLRWVKFGQGIAPCSHVLKYLLPWHQGVLEVQVIQVGPRRRRDDLIWLNLCAWVMCLYVPKKL